MPPLTSCITHVSECLLQRTPPPLPADRRSISPPSLPTDRTDFGQQTRTLKPRPTEVTDISGQNPVFAAPQPRPRPARQAPLPRSRPPNGQAQRRSRITIFNFGATVTFFRRAVFFSKPQNPADNRFFGIILGGRIGPGRPYRGCFRASASELVPKKFPHPKTRPTRSGALARSTWTALFF